MADSAPSAYAPVSTSEASPQPAPTQPAGTEQQSTPAAVAYSSQQQGAVMFVAPTAPKEPKYDYRPPDYYRLAVVMAVLCGLFSPCSLIFSVPAVLFSRRSRESYQRGDINNAKRNGLFAAFLTVTTIVFALLVAVIAIGLVLGVYAPVFFLEQCVSQMLSENDGLPPETQTSFNCRRF